MDTKKVAVNRAVQLLIAAGAQFKIIAGDQEFGDLQVVHPPKRKSSGIDFASIYKPVLEDMPTGDVRQVVAPSGMDAGRLRSVICGYVHGKWGAGSCITSVKGQVVEILRVQ